MSWWCTGAVYRPLWALWLFSSPSHECLLMWKHSKCPALSVGSVSYIVPRPAVLQAQTVQTESDKTVGKKTSSVGQRLLLSAFLPHKCENAPFKWPSSVTETPNLGGVDTKRQTVNIQSELAGERNPSKSACGQLSDNDTGPALQNVLVLALSRDFNSPITAQNAPTMLSHHIHTLQQFATICTWWM